MGRSADASVSDTLINLLYDAVLDESRWPQVTHALAQELGACALQFWTPALPVGAGGLSYRHGLDENTLKIYFDHYHQRDVWVQGSFARGVNIPRQSRGL